MAPKAREAAAMHDRETILGAMRHYHPGYPTDHPDSANYLPPDMYACGGKCSPNAYAGGPPRDDYWFAAPDVAAFAPRLQAPHGHLSPAVHGAPVVPCTGACPSDGSRRVARWVNLRDILAG